jgi:hypothetical protein
MTSLPNPDSENANYSDHIALKGEVVRRVNLIRILVASLVVAVAGIGASVGADVTSQAGPIVHVFTRTTDIPFTVNATGGMSFPVPFNLQRTNTLIISVSMRGVANSERGWGINCSGSTVTCEPFAGVEHFHAARRGTLSFTVVARNVPPGPGTVNLFVFADCTVACAGTEELTVETLAAVVEVAFQR